MLEEDDSLRFDHLEAEKFFSATPSFFMKDDKINLGCIRHHILSCIAVLSLYEKRNSIDASAGRDFYSALSNVTRCLSDSSPQRSKPLPTLFLLENFLPRTSIWRTFILPREEYLPFHWKIIDSSAPEDKKLITTSQARQNPNSVNATERKALLIHYAAASASVGAVKTMISPAAIRCKDARGRVPLHWAAMHSHSLDMLNYLLEEWPGATKARDKKGYTPFHQIVARDAFPEQLAMIERLLDADPTSCSFLTTCGKTALHVFCDSTRDDIDDPRTLFLKLLAAYPGAVSHKDCKGQVPLHYLCSNNRLKRKLPLLKLLLAAYKEGASFMDSDSLFPVHLAVQRGASVEEVGLLVDAYPEALSTDWGEEDENWEQATKNARILMTAMHYHFFDVVKLLLRRNSDLIFATDEDGFHPLHIAAHSGKLEIVKMIYAADPSAMKEYSNQGLLPLHYAFVDGVKNPLEESADVIRFLLRKCPESVNMHNFDEDGDGVGDDDQEGFDDDEYSFFDDSSPMKYSPYQLACRRKSCVYIQRILLRACPAADPQRLRNLNYDARRQLMFLAFAAITGDAKPVNSAKTKPVSVITSSSVSSGVVGVQGVDGVVGVDGVIVGVQVVGGVIGGSTRGTGSVKTTGDAADFIYQLRRLMNIGEDIGLLRQIASFL